MNQPSNDRRSLRLSGYDYSASGAYFVTICSRNRKCIFGKISDENMRLSCVGELVAKVWRQLPERFPIWLDEFVVMPNHVHGVIVIPGNGFALPEHNESNVGAGLALPDKMGAASDAPTLGEVVGAYKSLSTRIVNRSLSRSGALWQRNFFEHIIRNEKSLNLIREYIGSNLQRWEFDRENPSNYKHQ